MRRASVALFATALCGCAGGNADRQSEPWCDFERSPEWSQFKEPDEDATAVRDTLRSPRYDETLCPERPDRCAIRWFKRGNDHLGFCQETFGCSVDVVEFQKIDGKWEWQSGSIWIACDHSFLGNLAPPDTAIERTPEG